MPKLGLGRQPVAPALRTLPATVNNIGRRLRSRPVGARLVAQILATPEARQFMQSASNLHVALADRLATLEQRVLALEVAVHSLRSGDFRPLDALILAGWGDVRQDNIPTDVLIRALLGLPLPPPNGQV